MKKVYSKPCIIMEKFLLSERIAAGCVSPDPAFTTGCSVVVDPDLLEGWKAIGVFSANAGGCDSEISGAIDLNGDDTVDICYHTQSGASTGLNNVFDS